MTQRFTLRKNDKPRDAERGNALENYNIPLHPCINYSTYTEVLYHATSSKYSCTHQIHKIDTKICGNTRNVPYSVCVNAPAEYVT